ncbi:MULTISPECIES: hypothetical protein [Tenacibaculum]|uniref:hypothetical protein n=1 Tax=Tenacibaculum TaxID=104267 RepID=UPI000EAD3F30|nr:MULTISPECIES: hypothetical protein [Tenacibaculum]NVK07695.1 hypothetical protein [Tenacibaculum sp.]RLK02201.1 hypothetical protein C8N27_1334 [Tenacibaculum discolor]
MLNSISKLGNVLNKSEQREINGGILQCPDHTVYTCIGTPPMVSCWCQPYFQPGDEIATR